MTAVGRHGVPSDARQTSLTAGKDSFR